MALAFCMGTDLEALADADQPMAAIFFNSFGKKGTLALWAFVVLVQCVHVFLVVSSPNLLRRYMMGSSMVNITDCMLVTDC